MFFNSVLFGHRVYLFCSQMSERDQTAGGKWVKYNIGYYQNMRLLFYVIMPIIYTVQFIILTRYIHYIVFYIYCKWV